MNEQAVSVGCCLVFQTLFKCRPLLLTTSVLSSAQGKMWRFYIVKGMSHGQIRLGGKSEIYINEPKQSYSFYMIFFI